MCSRLTDTVHWGDVFGNKTGNFLHVLSTHHYLKIVRTGNKAQGPDLLETGKPFRDPVVPSVPLRAYFQLNNQLILRRFLLFPS